MTEIFQQIISGVAVAWFGWVSLALFDQGKDVSWIKRHLMERAGNPEIKKDLFVAGNPGESSER